MKRCSWTAIEGWEITYLEPTYGMRTFRVNSHAELARDREWLDGCGHTYTVREIPKGK